MGREIKRVSADFDWPMSEKWIGYQNPYNFTTQCDACDGDGYSPRAQELHHLWYGRMPFRPEDNGSTPFPFDHSYIWAFAKRNCDNAPEYYGRGQSAVEREARRLAAHWNGSWKHHLNQADIDALWDAERLSREFKEKPTPAAFNEWSLSAFGFSSMDYCVIKARCAREGHPHLCEKCSGEGHFWKSLAHKHVQESWQSIEPPEGDHYQLWETVSEGSPISPHFATPDELADWLSENALWKQDQGRSRETWLAFIAAEWAPSMVMANGVMQSGVDFVAQSAN